MDNDKTGSGLGLAVLEALAGAMLEPQHAGEIIVVGSLNLGGSIEMLPNALAIPHPYLSKRHRWLDHPIEEHSHETFRNSESGDCYGVLPVSCHSLLEAQ